MGMRINTNIEALNAQRNLGLTATTFGRSVEKLSSGLRINRASDDAAGLSISEKLKAQISGLNQAIRNSQDGISMIQTAEGALNEVDAMLQRMRELAVQASNDTLSASDATSVNTEMQQLKEEIDSTSTRTKFNGKGLLDGSMATANIQIGAGATDTLTVAFSKVDLSGTVGDVGGLDDLATALTTYDGAQSAANAQALITAVDGAIDAVNAQRSNFGAYQNRLEHTINNLGVASENLTASQSRIRDVDLAAEMVNFTKTQILQQAGTSILAQANQAPQSILQLLR